MLKNKYVMFAPLGLLGLTIFSGAFLMSSYSYATDDSAIDNVSITVPISCTMSGTGMNSHNANIVNGTYQADIGTTTLKAFCNDTNGFSIYAAGYTGDEIGGTNSTKLVGTSASSNATIDTGTNTGPVGGNDTSNWAIKLTAPSNPTPTYPITITSDANGPFSSYHLVPSSYTKVATRLSGTDIGQSAEGATLTTTYATYISKTQPADTYQGKVIYTLVHPYNHNAPAVHPAILDTGMTVNSKLKSLAAGTTTRYTTQDNYIKSINVHLETSAPNGFTPSEANTISSSTSNKPIYIVFDNTNDTGIMHFYTEGDQIVLPSDSSYMFYELPNLSGVSDISDWNASSVTSMSYMFCDAGESATTFNLDLSSWDTSSVTDMSYMFDYVGYYATTWSIGDLSNWNTSSVTNMSGMFRGAGGGATTWSIGDLSNWNTSSVTDMSYMFDYAGYSATTFNLDLSSWNTSNVTNMIATFTYAGYSATTWSIGNLSSWDTSSVTSMSQMFSDAGYSATTWSIGNLSSWDTSNVTSMSQMFSSAGHSATTWSIGNLSSWDTSSVTKMYQMFFRAGHSATTWSIGDLSSWDTSSVTNMDSMFDYAGYSASTFSLDLSNWDTSSVTNMNSMFSYAGYSATTFNLDLSSWDTSSVTNMNEMFYDAGYSATTFNLDLSSWDTSNVTNMTWMFSGAGSSATTWSVTIPPTNGNNISNTTSHIYGKTTSIYGSSPGSKSFTLAQP